MSWMNILFPPSLLFGGGKKEKSQKDKNLELSNYFLNQLMNEQMWIGKNSFNFGFDTLKETKGDIGYLQEFFKNILEGEDREQLLDFVDLDALDKTYADAEGVASELAPRGGARASTLGNLPFAKTADVQKMLSDVKAGSPQMLMQLAQMLSGLSGQALGTSANAYNAAAGAINTPLQLRESELERRNRLIGGLISAGGTIAGALIP